MQRVKGLEKVPTDLKIGQSSCCGKAINETKRATIQEVLAIKNQFFSENETFYEIRFILKHYLRIFETTEWEIQIVYMESNQLSLYRAFFDNE